MVLLKRTALGFALGALTGLFLIGALELWRYVRSFR